MRVLQGLDHLEHDDRPRAICVGAFDGFHLGHQYLLNRVCALARERNFDSGIVTFEPVPVQFFAPPGEPPRRLITLTERVAIAESLCCDLMVILEFNAELAGRSAAWFIETVLAQGLGTRLLIASSTHTMGHDRADIGRITEICAGPGIEVVSLPMLQLEVQQVNSSAIREALWQGRVEDANTMLGRHYSFAGPVVPGRGVGREIGFPTANIAPPPEKLIPQDGVYAGIASDETPGQAVRSWPAAISIGTAPTFGPSAETLIEAHILTDEALALAGHTVRLEFVHYLREQSKFDSAEELSRQIAADVQQTRELCHTLAAGGTRSPFCPRE
jgi:riboflavin kinase/FMN adenylyltransferase